MSVESQTLQPGIETAEKKARASTFGRIARYTIAKVIMLFITVAIGVYLTILIANMGGYVDSIMRGQIRENIGLRMASDPAFKSLTTQEKKTFTENEIAREEKRLGLDQPFVIRSFRYLSHAMVLELGRAQLMSSDEGSKQVRLIILERLPPTLLLFGTSNIFLFFGSVFFALALSRKYGTFWDKVVIGLSPTSSAPPWFYGIFLILIFGAVIPILPFGGMLDSPPPETQWGFVLSVGKHLILPVGAVILSNLFLSIYNWRTFFLIYSSEDYVEMAKAKGLSDREIERRYILRPTLPNIITNFSLLLIVLWTGSILTETVFVWPGLGRTFYQAIGLYDTAVIVGLTIIYAYLLVITVFFLEFVYAIVDPRVKIGEGS